MRKVLTALAGLMVMVPLMLVSSGVPAQALNNSPNWCDGEDVVVCTQFEWRDQNDGTGVYVEGVTITITQGCGTLEGDHPVNEMLAATYNNDNTFIKELQNISQMNDCSAYRDLELRGPDTGPAKVIWQGNMRVDLGPDYTHQQGCFIRPNSADECFTDFWG